MAYRSHQGYTLLEICLVLGVMAIIASLAIPYMGSMLREERIGKFSNACRDMAATARRRAIEGGRPCVIHFERNRLTLAWKGSNEVLLGIPVPRDIRVQIRGNAGDQWQGPNGQTWFFQNSGICEYLEIKAGIGEYWSQIAFNPLTAVARETASYYP